MSGTAEDFLNNLVAKLGSPYGAEKSIKIFHSRILDNRLLLSIHKNALGPQADTTLLKMLKELAFPLHHHDLVRGRLRLADIVHFGCEDYGKGHIYKCYFEHAENASCARESKSPEQTLVHYAIKWDPENAVDLKFSHYYLQTSPDLNTVKCFLGQVYREKDSSVAYKMMLEILELPEIKAIENDLMLLKVTEEDNARFSFDINLYNAEIQLSRIASQLSKIIEYFDADIEKWDRLYQFNKALQLGHLSGGIDGSGREFFTVYFGVEGRG